MFWKLIVFGVFGVNQFAVNMNVKDATRLGDQLGLKTKFLLNCGRQTGGLWFVVSLVAVGNRDIHDLFLLFVLFNRGESVGDFKQRSRRKAIQLSSG